jgi:hypothetical protein
MTRTTQLAHEFVDHFPDKLSDGVLYVCLPFASVAHLCCCGCGNEVITPLKPERWHLMFDGETISLRPSVGNWNFDCQSHYWIEHDMVRWAPRWTPEQIAAGRAQSRSRKVIQPDFAANSTPNAPAKRRRLPLWLRRLVKR